MGSWGWSSLLRACPSLSLLSSSAGLLQGCFHVGGGGEVVAGTISGCRGWTDSLRVGVSRIPYPSFIPYPSEGCSRCCLHCLVEPLLGSGQEGAGSLSQAHLGKTCDCRYKCAKKEQGRPSAAWAPELGLRVEGKTRPLQTWGGVPESGQVQTPLEPTLSTLGLRVP